MRKILGTALAASSLTLAAGGAAQAIGSSTADNLDTAMHGEAFAAAKYTLYGEQAGRDGNSQVATLFGSTAQVEQGQHFVEEATAAGLVGTSIENLQNAISGENYENTQMYPEYAAVAYQTQQTAAGDTLTAIAADEGMHRDLYTQALTDLQAGHDTTATAPALDQVGVTAQAPAVHGQLKSNIENAMHGEATAWTKYALFAEQARTEGYPNLAALFDGISTIEFREHFSEEANLVGLVGTTTQNLRDCIQGERFESTSMYPRYADQAARAGDTEAADLFREIAADEAGHLSDFQSALRG